MAFVQSPVKAFQKACKSRQYWVSRQNSVCWGSFRRRPWPFGERRSRNICHPVSYAWADDIDEKEVLSQGSLHCCQTYFGSNILIPEAFFFYWNSKYFVWWDLGGIKERLNTPTEFICAHLFRSNHVAVWKVINLSDHTWFNLWLFCKMIKRLRDDKEERFRSSIRYLYFARFSSEHLELSFHQHL